MPLNLKLPKSKSNSTLSAETLLTKVNAFIDNLPYNDPIAASSNLIAELKALNDQVIAFSNRINALEIYRQAIIRIHADLLPKYSSAALPISKNIMVFADASEQLWEELAYGYKAALVGLQRKKIDPNVKTLTALTTQRAIHALKEIIFVNLLSYKTPSGALWADLHQLYWSALQQAAEQLVVTEMLPKIDKSTVSATYTQALLLSLANMHRLSNNDIVKTDAYLTSIANEAELRKLGRADNTDGIFLVELDGSNPPTSYTKRKTHPKPETDLLLVTINLARRIHTHLKLLKKGTVPNDGSLPKHAVIERYEDLLAHLIKHFGKPLLRVFSRIKHPGKMELGIGINDAHYFIPKTGYDFKKLTNEGEAVKPSQWETLNSSASGFALRKLNSSQIAMYVGDIVAIQNNKSLTWEVGVVRWANTNKSSQLDAGFELISPLAKSVYLKKGGSTTKTKAILLPKLNTLKQTSSVIVARDEYSQETLLTMFDDDSQHKIQLTKLIERSISFERYQYKLI